MDRFERKGRRSSIRYIYEFYLILHLVWVHSMGLYVISYAPVSWRSALCLQRGAILPTYRLPSRRSMFSRTTGALSVHSNRNWAAVSFFQRISFISIQGQKLWEGLTKLHLFTINAGGRVQRFDLSLNPSTVPSDDSVSEYAAIIKPKERSQCLNHKRSDSRRLSNCQQYLIKETVATPYE